MAATETETVRLDLEGNFAAQAAKGANAADQLAASLDKLQKSADKLNAQRFDEAMKAFLGSRSSTPEILKPKIQPQFDFGKNAFAGIFDGVARAFGPKAAEGLRDATPKIIEGAEKLKTVAPLLKAGGAAVAAGAVALGAAAAALVYGAAKVVASAVTFGVEQTAAREKQAAIFKSLGFAGGEKVAIKLAADFGLDTEKAFEQVKGLLGAKFSAEEIPAIIRIAAGIGAVKGEGKAQAFLEKLETQAAKGGKASQETIQGFAEAGINVDSVWKALAAKLGVSVQQAQAKVKMGLVDMKTALDAVKTAGAAGFGGVADELGKSVPALVGKIKIQFAQLFSGFDLGPLKGALETVSKVLGGPQGEKLGGALTKLGNTVLKALFGPFEGAKGEERLTRFMNALTNAIEMTANAIAAIAPYIEMAVDGFTRVFGDRQTENATGFVRILFGVLDALSAIVSLDFDGFMSSWMSVSTGITQVLGGVVLGAAEAGLNVARGFAQGITGGMGEAIQAAIGMAQGAVQAAKQALGVASPSKAFEFLGSMSKEGFVEPMNDNADVSAAGKSMAESAVGGAAAAGGAGSARGGAGNGTINITVQVVAAPGQNAEQTGQQIADVIRRELRDLAREAQERAA